MRALASKAYMCLFLFLLLFFDHDGHDFNKDKFYWFLFSGALLMTDYSRMG